MAISLQTLPNMVRIASIKTDTDSTSVTISNINASRDDVLLLTFNTTNPADSKTIYHLYFNGDSTDTNYYTQYMLGNGSTLSSDRENASVVGAATASQTLACTVYIYVSPSGIIKFLSLVNRDDSSSVKVLTRTGVYTQTVTGISSITITGSNANSIGSGTVIELWKLRR